MIDIPPSAADLLLKIVTSGRVGPLKHHPGYDWIVQNTNYLPTTVPIARRAWHLSNEIEAVPVCLHCGITPVNWKVNTKSYAQYCSVKCAATHPSTKIKISQTKANWTSDIKDNLNKKRSDTVARLYGSNTFFKSEKFKQSTRDTTKAKFGVDHYSQTSEYKAKVTQTSQQKYGTAHYSQTDQYLQKRIATCNVKYGVDHYSQTEQYAIQYKSTSLQRYGVENYASLFECRKKMVATTLKKYGVVHYNYINIPQSILDKLNNCDWMHTQYVVNKHTTGSIATLLGVSSYTIQQYLHKHEIPIRQHSWYSNKCIAWLTSIQLSTGVDIMHAGNGGEFKIPGTRYYADGYCRETNTIYEFHGDCWHGNPQIYQPDVLCNPYSSLTAGQLYHNTSIKENKIKQLGYQLVTVWENEWDLICLQVDQYTGN